MTFDPYARRIQLWSDARGNEFAVRLSNEEGFRAVSNPTAKYTKLVEEAEYFSDVEYDWKFLLEHWVEVRSGKFKQLGYAGEKRPEPAPFDFAGLFAGPKPRKRRVKRETSTITSVKCRYCRLSYNSEKERREHELVWHFEKMKKDEDRHTNKPS